MALPSNYSIKPKHRLLRANQRTVLANITALFVGLTIVAFVLREIYPVAFYEISAKITLVATSISCLLTIIASNHYIYESKIEHSAMALPFIIGVIGVTVLVLIVVGVLLQLLSAYYLIASLCIGVYSGVLIKEVSITPVDANNIDKIELKNHVTLYGILFLLLTIGYILHFSIPRTWFLGWIIGPIMLLLVPGTSILPILFPAPISLSEVIIYIPVLSLGLPILTLLWLLTFHVQITPTILLSVSGVICIVCYILNNVQVIYSKK